MSTFESRSLLAESDRLKRKAVGDQRLSSVPLFVFAGIVGVGATLDYTNPGPGRSASQGREIAALVARVEFPWSELFYLVVVPVVLAGVFWAQRRRARRLGTVPIGGWPAGVALVVVPFLVQLLVLTGLGRLGPVAAAAGILVAAMVQRNWFLAGWISALGVVTLLLDDYFWENRIFELRYWLSGYHDPQYGYTNSAQYVAIAGVVVIIVAVGAWAARRERVR